MGELYLDNIDRVLLQEHRRYSDGSNLREAAKRIEGIPPERRFTVNSGHGRLSPEGDIASILKH
jgi:hypothetical protein